MKPYPLNHSFFFLVLFVLISYVPHLFCLEESQNHFCLEGKNLNLYTLIFNSKNVKKKMYAQIEVVNKD